MVVLRLGLYAYPVAAPGELEQSAFYRGIGALPPLSGVVGVAIAAMVFGIVDDVWGGKDAKGFRGHVGSLVRGRLTTGGLKLVGIGTVAFLAALVTVVFQGLYTVPISGTSVAAIALSTLLGTLVIALSANTVNLADLRPGRALKVGVLLLAFAVLSTFVLCVDRVVSPAGTALAVALVTIVLGGPMLAMWPYDVGERGMLGDAGANALGAMLGYAIFVGLTSAASERIGVETAILAVIAGLLLLVNALSERYSYSQIIERNGFLRRLDRLGRPVFDDVSVGPTPDES